MSNFQFSVPLLIQTCIQIIKISEEHSPFLRYPTFAEEVAMREEVQVRITIPNHNQLAKTIKCWDSISLAKLVKLEVCPMIAEDTLTQM
jgi:hypothetical protein